MKFSRRNFIRTLGLGTAALSIPGTGFAVGKNGTTLEKSELKISMDGNYRPSWNSLQDHDFPGGLKTRSSGFIRIGVFIRFPLKVLTAHGMAIICIKREPTSTIIM